MGAATSPGRRRTRVPGGRRVRVVVRLTSEEYEALAARAAEINHTVPSYLALTGLRPEGVASADIKAALINMRAVRRVTSGMANNLNQLTAKLHSTGEVDAGLPATVDAIAGLTNRLDAALERLDQLIDGRSQSIATTQTMTSASASAVQPADPQDRSLSKANFSRAEVTPDPVQLRW